MQLDSIRSQFPVLQQAVHGQPLVYLDSAASAQKPQCVIDAMTAFYQQDYSNIHRGVHQLSQRSTIAYEAVRDQVQAFIGAARREEIVFTSGTTAAINLVAQSFGQHAMRAGDEVIITAMEHHANIVPWQMLRDRLGVVLKVLPMTEQGELCVDQLPALLSSRTKLLACSHVSNVLGTINPVADIIAMAHAKGVPVLLDGAQAVPHMAVDVQALGCDFYVFSAHKMYGPTGVGVLYGKRDLLTQMPPYQGGGDMIRTVSFEKTTFNDLPYRFEAGTPNIAAVIGLGAAIKFMLKVGIEKIAAHEKDLLQKAMTMLSDIKAFRVLGQAKHKAAVISYVWDGVHAHDIGTILDQQGVAVRVGHHCAMPIMQFYGVSATTRASFAIYNNESDVGRWIAAMHKVQEVFV